MAKRLKHRLNTERGETLVEALSAILIASLSMIILANVIASASNILRTSSAKLEEYQEQNEDVVRQPQPDESEDDDTRIHDGTVKITVEGDTSELDSIPVTIYENSSTSPSVYSYRRK